mmetsp:Transcript_14014/g.29356  ORF Transcript_14014/g.29356 Transcript_14014/m.29356 type:complete len:111 (+) Transcript_14014:644-976(+)
MLGDLCLGDEVRRACLTGKRVKALAVASVDGPSVKPDVLSHCAPQLSKPGVEDFGGAWDAWDGYSCSITVSIPGLLPCPSHSIFKWLLPPVFRLCQSKRLCLGPSFPRAG